MTHSYVWHDAFICVTWRIHVYDMHLSYVVVHMCDMGHSHMWHDAFMCVICWFIWMSHATYVWHECVWHDPSMCVSWLIHTCDCITFHISQDAKEREGHVVSINTGVNESCHILTSHVTYEWVMSHMNASCHTYECVMSHMQMSHGTHDESAMFLIWMSHVTHMNCSCHTHECVMSHIWMGHVTHMNASCHS